MLYLSALYEDKLPWILNQEIVLSSPPENPAIPPKEGAHPKSSFAFELSAHSLSTSDFSGLLLSFVDWI